MVGIQHHAQSCPLADRDPVLSLAGVAIINYHFCLDKRILCPDTFFFFFFFCRDKHAFVATKDAFCHDKRRVLSRQTKFCCDKSSFVPTKLFLSRQNICPNICRVKHTCFVADVFCVCRDKHVLTLVAASASDTMPCPQDAWSMCQLGLGH